MGTQHEITEPLELLDEYGCLSEPGYARKLLWKYERSKIKAGWHRIKEWDYYYILNEDYGIRSYTKCYSWIHVLDGCCVINPGYG